MRRQTLKGAERYITPELKEFEDKVLGARERALAREKYLYEELLDKLHEVLGELQLMRGGPRRAGRNRLPRRTRRRRSNFCRSRKSARRPASRSTGGRHLVVEQVIDTPFIANDLSLDDRSPAAVVITGPNMGGKSTYMRQAALIVILAHIGSFVPADATAYRPGRPYLHAHRRVRRPGRREIDVHGRDDRDRERS